MHYNMTMSSSYKGDDDELTFDPGDIITNIEFVSTIGGKHLGYKYHSECKC